MVAKSWLNINCVQIKVYFYILDFSNVDADPFAVCNPLLVLQFSLYYLHLLHEFSCFWTNISFFFCRYNMIFRFLLSVRKVQIELHQCWALQMRSKGAGHQSSFMPLWKLRSHMSFLIDNFQYYVLVGVNSIYILFILSALHQNCS